MKPCTVFRIVYGIYRLRIPLCNIPFLVTMLTVVIVFKLYCNTVVLAEDRICTFGLSFYFEYC